MPHVIIKLWPGKSEAQKLAMTDKIVDAVASTLGYGTDSISVALEEVSSSEWKAEVYDKDIKNGAGVMYKDPGYKM